VSSPLTVPARGEPTPTAEAAGDLSPGQPTRTNLPAVLSSFIGREHEQGEVRYRMLETIRQ
jgi:hypothetical protein